MLNWSSILILAIAGQVAPAGQTPPAPAKPAKIEVAERSADPRDKMICKRFLDTGSLVRGTRVCKSKWEWERQREELRAGMSATNGCKSLDNSGGC